MRFTVVCLILLSTVQHAWAQSAVGSWRPMLNYSRAIDVAELGDEIFTATRNAIFIYNKKDNSLETLSKVNGLTQVGISMVTAVPNEGVILVGYENGNLDIVRDRQVTNYADIRNSTIQGNKTIRHAEIGPDFIYISTGIGILAFDLDRREIRNTYRITASEDVSINQTAVVGDTIFAATQSGLYYGSIQSDLTIFSNWSIDLSIPDPFGNVRNCVGTGPNLLINQPSASQPGIYTGKIGQTWELQLQADDILYVQAAADGAILNTTGGVMLRGADGTNVLINFINYSGQTARPSRAIQGSDGNLWIADRNFGLVKRSSDGNFEFIAPDGPGTNGCFSLTYAEGELWVASGAPVRPGTWSNNFNIDGFYKFAEGKWTNFIQINTPFLSNELFFDIPEVYRYPGNEERVLVGSYFSGVIEVIDGEIVNHFTDVNSSLEGSYTREDGKQWIAASGFTSDDEGNVWMVTVRSDDPLSVYRADGTWESFDIGLTQTDASVGMIRSRDGYHWIMVNRNGIRVFDPETGNVKVLNAQTGNGGLPTNEVFAVTEDRDGVIWVGTAEGVGVFFSPFDVFSDNPSDARPIIVEQGGIFQPLFENQPISCITIDGANRKWVGTFGSGLFLMSADGTEEIHRFTTANSPLLSNIINDVAVNSQTGEVYIATEEGIMIYTSEATEGGFENACTTVFPNPVRETYQGPISIRGLMRDTEVRITDLRGNLVASIVSAGGTAIWDGKNRNNERVSTGVYFALSSDEEGSSTCVSKILVIK
ncbi:MAG: two-component regulator propeller domain-containing protein [Cryomorphaceae bacterium]|nr:hypothetical protein [Flavobacteriales bacterium]